jgi:RNA polymerase sigma-70 factor (ECF subfamily)
VDLQLVNDDPAGRATGRASARPPVAVVPSFRDRVATLFDLHFQRLYRVMNRLSGEPELAADLAQEAFIRLHQRGSLPDQPEAWLISVAMNLFRNEYATRKRRKRLLTLVQPGAQDDVPAADRERRRRVQAVLEVLPERDRKLLVLSAEGYRHRDLAAVLGLHEASVGVFLARARRAFRAAYGESADAPE